MDIRLLRDDQTEVEIGESVDYSTEDYRSLMNLGENDFTFPTEDTLGEADFMIHGLGPDDQLVDMYDTADDDDDTYDDEDQTNEEYSDEE